MIEQDITISSGISALIFCSCCTFESAFLSKVISLKEMQGKMAKKEENI
jgi:hypothetical protein